MYHSRLLVMPLDRLCVPSWVTTYFQYIVCNCFHVSFGPVTLRFHFHCSCWRPHKCTTLDYYSGHHWTGCGYLHKRPLKVIVMLWLVYIWCECFPLVDVNGAVRSLVMLWCNVITFVFIKFTAMHVQVLPVHCHTCTYCCVQSSKCCLN